MDSRYILQLLLESKAELNAAGIEHLRLFGSAARGDMSPHSDIDLLADFNSAGTLTLLTLGRLQHRLSTLLGVTVDLSAPSWMRESIRQRALAESLLVF